MKKKMNISVWVIEDNALFRKNLVSLINEQSDLKCEREFSSCEDAIKALQISAPPSVVLQDIGFSGMSGIESVEMIKSLHPEIQIIMITVFDDNDNIFDALCAGATGYLLKSSPEEMIIKSIRDVVAGGSPMNSSIARKVIQTFVRKRNLPEEYGLSSREKEILDQIVQGFTNRQIAEHNKLSTHTVDAHLRKIYNKLHVHTRTEAATKAVKERLV